MKNFVKLPYEEAKLEVLSINEADIITTSTTMGDGENFDDKAWT